MLLLRMLTGSRLYGTAHAGSDYDWYEVYDKIKPQHTIVDGQDVQRWPLGLFMSVAAKGGPSALELMFAPPEWPEVDFLGPLRASYCADPWNSYKRFTAKIQEFLERGDEKGRMHAVRLQDNLNSVMSTGRYDPVWRKQ